MTLAVALLGGFAATALLLATTRAVLGQPILERENYRGHRLPTAAGILLVSAVIAVDGARTLLAMTGIGDPSGASTRLLILLAVAAFGFLGLVDDLLGDANDRGLRGHITAACRGRVTTGFVKLGGGVAVALLLASLRNGDHPGRVLIDAAVIALAANLGNLFDRAPGRTAKWALLAYVPLAVVAGSSVAGVALAVVMGATLALLAGDLKERFMLGDTGANAIGAALGVVAVCALGGTARTMLAGVLLALTLLSEVVSFSVVIERVPPLRMFDQLGRRREGGR